MSFRFHVPPANKLSINQQQAIKMSLNGKDCLLVTGCPGSGKTTVANFRAAALEKEGKNYQYIIYARMLEAFVKESLNEKDLVIDADKISTFARWFREKFGAEIMEGPNKVKSEVLKLYFKNAGKEFSEMIFDETQDLDINIIRNLPFITGAMTICTDDAQSVYDETEKSTTVDMIKNALELKSIDITDIHLDINYRNPPEIYAFARAFIPNNPSSNIEEFMKEPGQKPVVMFTKSKVEMFDRIINIIKNRRGENIGILCDKIDQIKQIATYLKQRDIEHTAFHSQMLGGEKRDQLDNMKNVIVCTNKSAKGLEFQTVIIPFAEEMKTGEVWRKSYYVACTRAERSLFLMTSSTEKEPTLIAQIDANLYERV